MQADPVVLQCDGLGVARILADALKQISFDLIIALSPEAHSAALEFTSAIACDVEFWPIAHPGDASGSRETQLLIHAG